VNITGLLSGKMLLGNLEVDLLEACMTENRFGVIDGNSVVALLSAHTLQLGDVSPIVDDLGIMTGKIQTLVDSPLVLIADLILN
jgi:hypothetical protein